MKPVLLWMLILAVAPWIEAQQSTSATPQKSISSYLGLHTFPAKNQAAAQQPQDEMACYSWAKQDSGFDPLAAATAQQQSPASAPVQPTAPQTQGAGVKGVAGGAARGAVVGAIAGDAGKGAEVGAAAGAVGGRRRARRAQEQAQKQAQQQQQQQAQQQAQAKTQTQQKLDGFKRGFGACMEAKGYVVK
jgi:Glycine zipper